MLCSSLTQSKYQVQNHKQSNIIFIQFQKSFVSLRRSDIILHYLPLQIKIFSNMAISNLYEFIILS